MNDIYEKAFDLLEERVNYLSQTLAESAKATAVNRSLLIRLALKSGMTPDQIDLEILLAEADYITAMNKVTDSLSNNGT